jgi:hypothetical protein
MSLRSGSQQPGATATELGQWLVAIRGGTHFAFPAEVVRGLASSEAPPSAEERALPRADLMRHFPGASAPGSPRRGVLCGNQVAEHVVLVDDVIGLTEIHKEQIRPLPRHFTGSERLWFAGLFLFQDTVALMVNPEWLLVPEERLAGPRLLGPGSSSQPMLEPVPDPRVAADGISSAGATLDELILEEATDVEDIPWADL